jgi:alpha-tubulin suppressor-like RCC1 family protein
VIAISNHKYFREFNQFIQLDFIGIPGKNNLLVTCPTLVLGLEGQQIERVYCGFHCAFALSKDGEIFSWGCGDRGLLGHGNYEDYEFPG